jgi:hypothetical protein
MCGNCGTSYVFKVFKSSFAFVRVPHVRVSRRQSWAWNEGESVGDTRCIRKRDV